MRNVIKGLFIFLIIAILFVAVVNVYTKDAKQKEIQAAVTESMEESLNNLSNASLKTKSEEDLRDYFVAGIAKRVTSVNAIQVEIYGIDYANGMIDAKVTVRYPLIIGNSTVTFRKTMVVDSTKIGLKNNNDNNETTNNSDKNIAKNCDVKVSSTKEGNDIDKDNITDGDMDSFWISKPDSEEYTPSEAQLNSSEKITVAKSDNSSEINVGDHKHLMIHVPDKDANYTLYGFDSEENKFVEISSNKKHVDVETSKYTKFYVKNNDSEKSLILYYEFDKAYADEQYVIVDLSSIRYIKELQMTFGTNYPKHYVIQTSIDKKTWNDVEDVSNNTKKSITKKLDDSIIVRYVKVSLKSKHIYNDGYKIKEIKLYKELQED